MKTMMAMAALIGVIGGTALAGDTGRAETIRKLETMKVSVDFDNIKLIEAMDYLRDVTGLNLVILPKAHEKDPELKVRLRVRDLTVKSTLKLMLSNAGLTATYRDGAIVILPREDLQDSVTLRMFDVRALMVKIQDFAGPKVELASPSANGPNIGGVFTLEEPRQSIPEDFLVTMIKENTGGGSWDSNSKTAISLANGTLVISQSPSVHREIERLLGLLGQYQ